jgi:AcrR family transcriptional regulator
MKIGKWIYSIQVDTFYPLQHNPSKKPDTVNPLVDNLRVITLTKPDEPLRRDAERNRQRILDAARELFADHGLGVTLNDIAHHAGVGVGTVYRRFPDKTQLIEELFEQRLEDLVSLASRALDEPDPWHGLKTFLRRALELQATDRGVKDLITASTDGLDRVGQIRSRLMPIGLELIRRARETGQIRSDIDAPDLPVIQLMLSTLIDASRDVSPDLWRRYLGIITRGLSAHPELEPELGPSPLAPDQVDHVMSFLKPARR